MARSFIEVKFCLHCGKPFYRKVTDGKKKWEKRRFHNSRCGQLYLAEHREERSIIPAPKLDFLNQPW